MANPYSQHLTPEQIAHERQRALAAIQQLEGSELTRKVFGDIINQNREIVAAIDSGDPDRTMSAVNRFYDHQDNVERRTETRDVVGSVALGSMIGAGLTGVGGGTAAGGATAGAAGTAAEMAAWDAAMPGFMGMSSAAEVAGLEAALGLPAGALAAGGALGGGIAGGAAASGGGGILGSLGSAAGGLLSNPSLLGAGLGALLSGAGGGSKPAGTTTTVQDIPEWVKPYAIQGMQGLSQAYSATPNGVHPITQAGGNYMQDVIGGDYLNNNPYLDAMFNKAAGKVSAGVNSQFSGAGRYGSGAHSGVLGESLGNLATDIYGGNYARERGYQQSAALQADDFGTASILQPFAKSKALLEGVGSIGGGTTTQPYFRNRTGELLAGALGGAQLGGIFK